MPDRLRGLVETIVGSLPIQDPHVQQRQQRSIVDLRPIDYTEPFSPSDHMGPRPIVKVEVREDVIPPPMVCHHLILPLFSNPVEGSLGNLQLLFSVSIKKKQREKLP